jgi:hypothetical protein
VILQPGSHTIGSLAGAILTCTVDYEGHVAYASSLEGLLRGSGTSALELRGVGVTIDSSLYTPGGWKQVWIDGRALSWNTSTQTIRLLPGAHTIASNGGMTLHFQVDAAGIVSYTYNDDTDHDGIADDPLNGILGGEGTNTLQVLGRPVSITASLLGADSAWKQVWIDGVAISWNTASLPVSLLPGAHTIGTQGGMTLTFQVGANGLVSYTYNDVASDPLNGVLGGEGTSTLSLVGRQVMINASAWGVSSLWIDGRAIAVVNGILAEDPLHPELGIRLLPGQHTLSRDNSVLSSFIVNDDGTFATTSLGIVNGNNLRLA